MKKIISTILATLAIGLGVATTFGAEPAAAATSTTACFRWSDGSLYRNSPVQLFQTTSNGVLVQLLRNGHTNDNGCATFYNTPSNMYLVMRGTYTDVYFGTRSLYIGYTRIATPGIGGQLLGLAYLYQIA